MGIQTPGRVLLKRRGRSYSSPLQGKLLQHSDGSTVADLAGEFCFVVSIAKGGAGEDRSATGLSVCSVTLIMNQMHTRNKKCCSR